MTVSQSEINSSLIADPVVKGILNELVEDIAAAGSEIDPTNVAITGGDINGTTVGDRTPAPGSFTTVEAVKYRSGSAGDSSNITYGWDDAVLQFSGLYAVPGSGAALAGVGKAWIVHSNGSFRPLSTNTTGDVGDTTLFVPVRNVFLSGVLGWAAGPGLAADVNLTRDAANSLGMRNGAAAQVFNLYSNYTDGSNNSRLELSSNGSGVYQIVSKAVGTGIAGTLFLGQSGVQRLGITGAQLYPAADNNYDLGSSGNRFKTLFASGGQTAASRTVVAATTITVNDYVVRFDTSAGGITQVMPVAPTNGTLLILAKINTANILTISAGAGDTVNGAASVTIGATRGSLGFSYDRTAADWTVISKF
jgi:hypothetical protein